MSTTKIVRLGIGQTVLGVVMVAWCLTSGQRSLVPTWDAAHTLLSMYALIWMWAVTPRLTFDEAREDLPLS